MKVLIDAHMVGNNEGGNERYIRSLVRELGKLIAVDVIVSSKSVTVHGAKRHFVVKSSNIVRYLNEIPKLMKRENYDLVLTTYFVAPTCANSNVIMVHDMLPFRNPEYFSLKERIQFLGLGYSIKKARKVIVPSRFVADEITYFFPNQRNKVVVIPEAADTIFKPYKPSQRSEVRNNLKLRQLCVLVVASRFAKRPLKPVLKGLNQLKQSVTAVVLGAESSDRISSTSKVEVRYLGNISDAELSDLYNAADMVIYPSKYEGFGLPVLEAMACKTILLTTKIPPVTEIAGKAPIYFEIDKPYSLARAINKVRSNKKYRLEKIERGYIKAKSYSWIKTAELTKNLFMQIRKGL